MITDKPQSTPDCCGVWPELLYTFRWMVFADFPSFFTMPYVDGIHGQHRINFCPSCGADRRDCIVEADRVYRI